MVTLPRDQLRPRRRFAAAYCMPTFCVEGRLSLMLAACVYTIQALASSRPLPVHVITFVVLAPLLRNQVTALWSLEAARAPAIPQIFARFFMS